MLPLTADRTLLEQAVRRLEGLIPLDRVLVITGRAHVEQTTALLPDLPAENVLAEPEARSTGPALAWATAVARGRDRRATLLSMHADWFVGDDGAFRSTARRALDAAERHDVLVTVGIVPTRPEVGYGYIQPGEPLDAESNRVQRFIEKPNAAKAAQLIQQGALWNSGLFAWTAERFFAETAAVATELAPHLHHLEARHVEEFFRAVTPVAVDVSHFERSTRVAVVPGRFPWDDVGTWSALSRVRPADDAGNVAVGDAVAHRARDCVIWADDGPLVVDGVEELVVVRANGVTLVTTKHRAAQLKDLLDALPRRLRELEP
jgi:mannose-1-phosphate guanylyltransferase